MDAFGGSCDAFCVIKFAEQEHKTTTKKNTYSPDWDEVLMFVVEEVGGYISGMEVKASVPHLGLTEKGESDATRLTWM